MAHMTDKVANKQPLIVLEEDVFAVTPKGRKELGGAGTSLPQQQLEVLVLIDGRSSAGATLTRAESLGLGHANALAAMTRLVEDGLIELVKTPAGTLDFVDFFSVKGQVNPATASAAEAKRAAAETAALLKERGYFVGIARRPAASKRGAAAVVRTVVVVEDEAILAQLLKHVLEAEGFQVRTAMNRQEIVDQIRRAPIPDLVLLDVMLPDADGFEVLDRIRQHPALKTLPVVMLTAKATRESVLTGLRGGANGYITKPFEIPVLLKAVHAVLGMPEGRDVLETPEDPWPA